MKHTTTVVLASLLSTTPAAADAVIAVRGDADKIVVYKVHAGGLTKIVTDPGDVADFGWSDPKTLWVRYASDTETLLGKIVDGKIEKLTASPGPLKVVKDNTLGLAMHTTKNGQVWMEYCLQMGDFSCEKATWLRVDLPKQKPTNRRPANLGPANAPGFPAVAAPKGYKVTLQQVVADGLGDDQKKTKTKGAVCQGPSASKTWPDNTVDLPFAMKPSKVTWLRADPPVAMISGKATNPIGQTEFHEAVFYDCKTLYAEARWFGAGAWGLQLDGTWQIYVDAKVVAKLAAEAIAPAPSK